MREVFGNEDLQQPWALKERVFRFVEEAAELAQAMGLNKEETIAVVNWVFTEKAPGEPKQEAAGTLVTLLGLCAVARISLDDVFTEELKRISTPEVVARVRARQEEKRKVLNTYGAKT